MIGQINWFYLICAYFLKLINVRNFSKGTRMNHMNKTKCSDEGSSNELNSKFKFLIFLCYYSKLNLLNVTGPKKKHSVMHRFNRQSP